jgi:GT2 family glycosyltransferase
MTRATVTAVVVNYKTGGHLQELVDSLAQEPELAKIVIVDNASGDASLDFLEDRLDPRLHLIRNADNRGFGAACNQGAAVAETPYLLFINPDCLFPAGSLGHMTALLEARTEVAMLGPLILNGDGSEQRGCRRYLPNPRRSILRVLGMNRGRAGKVRGFDLVGTPLPSVPTEVEAVSGACMLLRRDIFMRLAGWDEGYFLHCEDLDICMRIQRAGCKILFVPDVAVIHHQGQSSWQRPVFVLWHKHRGMWRFYNKFYRADAFWLLTLLVWVGIWVRFPLLTLGEIWNMIFRRYRHPKVMQ